MNKLQGNWQLITTFIHNAKSLVKELDLQENKEEALLAFGKHPLSSILLMA